MLYYYLLTVALMLNVFLKPVRGPINKETGEYSWFKAADSRGIVRAQLEKESDGRNQEC